MQSFIMNSHEVFIHIHQGCFAGTGAIVRLPQCQWSKPDGYGKISQCITTTKHSKAKTVCIFLGIYCTPQLLLFIDQIGYRKWPMWRRVLPYCLKALQKDNLTWIYSALTSRPLRPFILRCDCLNLSKHRETHGCVVSIVANDALVLKHLAISIHNAD